ncbi:MAG: UDP-3-O-acyl-N-acetylglucosamine deacetylase, partial [Candidatus Omnitrophota bacterium]|nr:UDP-3-O-acyl-N-acetylglucosamine deacetylase [Candidatus Omnitrophota bacterium]
MRQRTIKDPVIIEGIGLHTGSKTKLVIKGAPADSGINFIRVDLPDKPLLNIKSSSLNDAAQKERRTYIGSRGKCEIETTEHLLAALSGLGLSNIIIETDGPELPGLDGSAKDYVDLLDRADIIEQDSPVQDLVIEKPSWCADEGAFLSVFPHKTLCISYFLSYPVPSIGDQFLSLEISEEVVRRELAPARTFC